MKPEFVQDWKAETWCYGSEKIDQFMIKYRGVKTGRLVQVDVFSAVNRFSSQPIGRFLRKS